MGNTSFNSLSATVLVDIGRVLADIHATSAYLFAASAIGFRLSSDQNRLITVKLREGFDDLLRRISGYVASAEFGAETAAITLRVPQHLGCSHALEQTGDSGRATALIAAAVENTLTQYALMCFYDHEPRATAAAGTYRTAWLQARAHTMVLLSRL